MKKVFFILLLSIVIACGLSFFASKEPDGLERVAINLDFEEHTKDSPFSIIPDYQIPGFNSPLSGSAAGLLGIFCVFALAAGAGFVLKKR